MLTIKTPTLINYTIDKHRHISIIQGTTNRQYEWCNNFDNSIIISLYKENMRYIACGDFHSLAISEKGKLFGWG